MNTEENSTNRLIPRWVSLDEIRANPFQPRTSEDIEAIVEVAASIYKDGLMQIPSARIVDGHYELAFGHTRKAAFALLAYEGLPDRGIPADPRFAQMPLYLRDLDDRQMFEMAVAENLKRRDLNPIELASAMKRYMEEFGASSEVAGELFNLKGATVRGMVRLLKLPEKVQQKVVTGEISQVTARRLVSIAQIDEQAALTAAGRIGQGSPDSYVLSTALNGNKQIVKMWQRWQRGEPCGGAGLWPLDTQPEKFPALDRMTAGDAAKALGISKNPEIMREVVVFLEGSSAENDLLDPDIRQRLETLMHPPACTGCPFHLTVEKEHYCGLKPCHRRKSAAWLQIEAARLSKRLGIAIYDPEADGKQQAGLCEYSWYDESKVHDKLIENADANLRLAYSNGDGSHRWTEHPRIRVIAVGELAARIKAAESQPRHDNEAAEMRARWEQIAIMREAVRKFMEEIANPLFAGAFHGLQNVHVMAALVNSSLRDRRKNQTPADLRIALAQRALNDLHYSQISEGGPVRVAKHLVKVAATWGVDLPPDFAEMAKKYQPVSTETAGKKEVKNG